MNGRPLTGEQGKLFRRLHGLAGIEPCDCLITYVFDYHPCPTQPQHRHIVDLEGIFGSPDRNTSATAAATRRIRSNRAIGSFSAARKRAPVPHCQRLSCASIREDRKGCNVPGRILEFLASRPRPGPPRRAKSYSTPWGETTPAPIPPAPRPTAATVCLLPPGLRIWRAQAVHRLDRKDAIAARRRPKPVLRQRRVLPPSQADHHRASVAGRRRGSENRGRHWDLRALRAQRGLAAAGLEGRSPGKDDAGAAKGPARLPTRYADPWSGGEGVDVGNSFSRHSLPRPPQTSSAHASASALPTIPVSFGRCNCQNLARRTALRRPSRSLQIVRGRSRFWSSVETRDQDVPTSGALKTR